MVMIRVDKKMSSTEAFDLSGKFGKENVGVKAVPDGTLFYVPDTTREELIGVINKAGYRVVKEKEENE